MKKLPGQSVLKCKNNHVWNNTEHVFKRVFSYFKLEISTSLALIRLYSVVPIHSVSSHHLISKTKQKLILIGVMDL